MPPTKASSWSSGSIVAKCIREGKVLEDLLLEEYKDFDDSFENDLYDEINLDNCVAKRISEGGTSVASVEKQIEYVRNKISK